MRRCLLVLIPLSLIYGCESLPGLLSFLNDLTFNHHDNETGAARIRAFESEDEFAEYFASRFNERNDRFRGFGGFDLLFEPLALDDVSFESIADGGAGAAPPPTGAGDQVAPNTAGDFSQTTIQEQGVDEADVVKTDGTNIYIISGDRLRIVRASPAEQLASAGEVTLEGNGRELYLHGKTVMALSETFGGFFFGGGILEGPVPVDSLEEQVPVDVRDEASGLESVGSPVVPQFDGPRTIVTLIDASSPESPQILSTTKFDGTVTASRLIGGVLHLVLANYQRFYYEPVPLIGRGAVEVSPADAESLLPRFERVDASGTQSSGPALTWSDLYRPDDPDGFGVVTVVSMDVASGDFNTVGIVAEPGLVYSSRTALYLTDTNYDFFGNTRETTDIYKLAYGDGTGGQGISGTRATPVASGTVPGRILNQYSMGEHNGYLRVATTVGPTFTPFGGGTESSNGVYVLEEAAGELRVVGSVENIAPRETIQACRFVGDRGYVVTFEQIDPLFTLDLSNPNDPVIVGELKVPGFSTYVVEMDSDHLLTVGQHIPENGPFFGNWGVQLSIFDISDFSNPVLKHNVVLGESTGASSEALHNPKAFTYFAERGLVALPVSIFSGPFFFGDFDLEPVEPGRPEESVDVVDADEPIDVVVQDEPIDIAEPFVPDGFDGLVVYSISAQDGFRELGRISTRFEQAGFYWNSFTRGVFIGEDVFAVTDNGVVAAPIVDIQNIAYELLLGPPDGFGASSPGDVGALPGVADVGQAF
ncbi:MAG: beta-propeller domain-containing protein [Phycisphaerae bacterium]